MAPRHLPSNYSQTLKIDKMKSIDDQIAALEKKLSLMKFKKQTELAQSYANLIGVCMKLNHCVYHMITGIVNVKELTLNDPEIKDDKEIQYNCVQVLWNPKEKRDWRTAEVSVNHIGRINASLIPKRISAFGKFQKALNNCSEWIKNKADEINTAMTEK